MTPALSALGVVSAAGVGAQAFSDALRAGESCITQEVVPGFSPEAVALGRCRALASVPGEDRGLTLARSAMAECLRGVGAGLPPPERLGLVLGTTCGGTLSLEAALGGEEIFGGGRPQHIPFDAVTKGLAREFNIRGPTRTLTVACASGTQVFELARGLLRSGRVDGVFVGAVDTVSAFILRGFSALRGLGAPPYRIFRGEPGPGGGVILGEGAAIIYMEPRALALRGGRPILGTFLGCFGGNEGHALTRPRADGEGIARCVGRALKDAGLEPANIDHISLHGTGTRAGDEAEYAGLVRVFGEGLGRLGYSAIKPIIGHTSGAAGALELGGLLLAAKGGFRPALAGAEAMTLPIPTGISEEGPIGIAASLGAGFGGSNAALIVRCGGGGTRGLMVASAVDSPGGNGLKRGRLKPWITALGVAIPGEGLVTPPPGESKAGAWLRGEGDIPLSRESQRLDPLGALFVLAAHRALVGVDIDRSTLGLSLGSALGCLESSEAFLRGRRANPIIFQNTVSNAALAYVAMVTGAMGPSLMLTQGPNSGLVALEEGRRLLEEGQCPRVLVIGGDRPSPESLSLDNGPINGDVLEGSIALLLEDPEVARARGARPLGVLSGFEPAEQGEVSPADAVVLAMPNGLVKVALSSLDYYQRIGAGVGAVTFACQGRP